MILVASFTCGYLHMVNIPDPDIRALTATSLRSSCFVSCRVLYMHQAHGEYTTLLGECSEEKPLHTDADPATARHQQGGMNGQQNAQGVSNSRRCARALHSPVPSGGSTATSPCSACWELPSSHR